MKQETVKLNTIKNKLRGKYHEGDLVLILCDATLGSFNIDLPDCRSVENVWFKFVRTDILVINSIILDAYSNQLINNSATYTLGVGSSIILSTDNENWWF